MNLVYMKYHVYHVYYTIVKNTVSFIFMVVSCITHTFVASTGNFTIFLLHFGDLQYKPVATKRYQVIYYHAFGLSPSEVYAARHHLHTDRVDRVVPWRDAPASDSVRTSLLVTCDVGRYSSRLFYMSCY